jgi:DNA-binding transcriptional MerR regulator
VSQTGGAAPVAANRLRRQAALPPDSTPLYTVGQVAELLDVQAAFVRRLDTEEVVVPARSSGGQRRYSRQDIDHIAAILPLLAEGLTLAGAQRIIELENEVAALRHQLDVQRQRERRG